MSAAAEEIWAMLRELTAAQQATERLLNEKFQETDRQLKERAEETDRRIKETDRQLQKTNQEIEKTDQIVRNLSKQFGDFGNRLGEFVEEMVRPAVIRLFRSRGLEVHQVMRDVTAIDDEGNQGIEVDLLITNAETAIGVECKSRLTLEDVNDHLARLARFKRLFPQYKNYRLLGAVAAMVLPDDVARYAYRQGLFVLAQSGEAIQIRNDDRFTPKVW